MRTSVITLLFIPLLLAALLFASGCAAPKSKQQEGSTRLRTTDDFAERGGPCNPCSPLPSPPKW